MKSIKSHELPHDLQAKIRQLCVKQSTEMYLQDDADLYIPPCASQTPNSRNVSDLNGTVNDFIESSNIVLLILGEGGTGKSFFCQSLIKRKSEHYEPGHRIPLYILLPSVRKFKTHLMQEALKKYGFTSDEIEQLRIKEKFIVVFDAYDETGCFDNLYITNNMEYWDVKVVSTCRPSYLTQETNYKRLFMPVKEKEPLTTALLERYFSPFVPGQIDQYITQYLSVKQIELQIKIRDKADLTDDWLAANTYKAWIEKLPGLKELIGNAFLLRLTMDILPDVVVLFQTTQNTEERFRMTSVMLYDIFFDQWLTRQENKLIAAQKNIGRNFQKSCRQFAKALGKKMHEKNIHIVQYEDESSLENMFGEDEESNKEMAEWAIFFSDNMIPQDQNSEERKETRRRCRDACLVKKVGHGQWSFIHATFRDYFMTLNMVGPQKISYLANTDYIEQSSATLPQTTRHRIVGRFSLMNRFNAKEADDLFKSEGIRVVFEQGVQDQKVILGQGHFGKFRIARNVINQRFAGVKKIHGEAFIKESQQEAICQGELTGLPNVMPIWDSQLVKNKKDANVLMQFMPLAGFGSGGLLFDLLPFIEDSIIKTKFLIHILKSLLTGVKGIHNRKIRHLDIKPANFVITCKGEILIIDFGCAVRDYGNKTQPLMRGGIGDNHYFPPERLAHFRKRYLKKLPPSDNYELAENFDAEKSDIWAIGLSLLEFYTENQLCLAGCDNSIDWKLANWNSQSMNDCFKNIIGWNEANENSLLGVIKILLRTDPMTRPSAISILNSRLFLDPKFKISEAELLKLMKDLIKWKTEPPQQAKLSNNEALYSKAYKYTTKTVYAGLGDSLYSRALSEDYSSATGYLDLSDDDELKDDSSMFNGN